MNRILTNRNAWLAMCLAVGVVALLWLIPSRRGGESPTLDNTRTVDEDAAVAGGLPPTDPIFRDALRDSIRRALGADDPSAEDAAVNIVEWVGLSLADDLRAASAKARSKALSWFFDCYSARESREFEIATRRMRRSELELLDRPPHPYEAMSMKAWADFIETAPLAELYLIRGQMESPIRRVLTEHTKAIRVAASVPSDDRLRPIQSEFETTLDVLAAKLGPPRRFSMGPPLFVACDDGGSLSPYYDFAESMGVIVVCESQDGRLSALLSVFVKHPQRGWIPSLILTRTWLLRADAPDAPWRPRI